jgi:hypothetical protein
MRAEMKGATARVEPGSIFALATTCRKIAKTTRDDVYAERRNSLRIGGIVS